MCRAFWASNKIEENVVKDRLPGINRPDYSVNLCAAQALYWDRGRPARNEREARKNMSGIRLLLDGRVCGRDARGPSKELESDFRTSQGTFLEILSTPVIS